MAGKMKKMMVLLLSMILIFSLGASVMAEDDHEKGEHHNKGEYYERSYDDEYGNEEEDEGYEEGNGPETSQTNAAQTEYWNIWSRQPFNNMNNPMPVTTPTDLSVSINGKTAKLYFIPQEGQMLVSGEAIATALGAKVKYYPQSKILVLTKDKLELIVRAGSNAAYENKVKNPMPVKAAAYEKTVYLPASVAANALGYRITWDKGKNSIIFTSI